MSLLKLRETSFLKIAGTSFLLLCAVLFATAIANEKMPAAITQQQKVTGTVVDEAGV